ncbi:pimeloyl-ACP methyl ester carboxylesterase [Metabacillus crassostreae]|uniref:alpha/beta fold hydrolase n=1 Tax=Metabacillus crassostreae TaxID=929098 RepID=UPI00195BD8B7|nr:alpha/beta hydrolase [Metabacillus crassostreae]MBM7602355.1 pimeloyl-ACP methyl ester carboxylesterase [Metabacillus crassostreae]
MHAEQKINIGKYMMNTRFFNENNCSEVVVLVHGIPTNSHLWDYIIPFLSKKYAVLAVELIGYGHSDRGPYVDLTLPKQAEYITSVLDQLNIPCAHFVGHDLGGGIVQILAVTKPERIKSLVVIDGVCFSNWPLPKVVSIRYPVAEEFVPNTLFIERMLREGVYHPSMLTPELLKHFTLPFATPTGPEELQQASLALNHHQTEDLVPYLGKITCPATFLWGQHDRYLVPYWGLLLHKALPNSVFKLIPNASHYSMIDQPSIVANELLNHLARSTNQPLY